MEDEIKINKELIIKISTYVIYISIGILIGLVIGYLQSEKAVAYANTCYETMKSCICGISNG